MTLILDPAAPKQDTSTAQVVDKLPPQPRPVRHEPLGFRFPRNGKNDARSKDGDRCGMTRAKVEKRIHTLRREDGAVLKIGQMLRVGTSHRTAMNDRSRRLGRRVACWLRFGRHRERRRSAMIARQYASERGWQLGLARYSA